VNRRQHGAALVVALDIGTSSVRALLYDSRLRPLPEAAAHIPHRPRLTADGGAELDYRQLRREVVTAVDRALAAVSASSIVAVGISSFWHGLLAAEGERALTPVFLWSDGRAWREAAALRRRLDEGGVHRRTGCRLHPTYWPAKISWLRRLEPRLRRPAVGWRSPADLLWRELLGPDVTSESLASATGLLGLRTRRWDSELLADLGLEPDRLPPLTGTAGRLTRRWARRWPQLATAVWAPVVGDGAAANLGSGCLDPGRRALTVGTSAALRVTVAAPPRSLPGSLWCYRAGGGRFIVGGALSNGGNLFEWLRQTLALPDPEVALSRPGAAAAEGELTFLPLLAGERSPGYALHATGAIAGITQATSAADLLRAGLEGVAVELARIDRELDRVAPGAEVVIASGGGLLANRPWMRMICDALDRPLRAGHALEASARGAALAGLEAAGLAPPDLRSLDPGAGPPLLPDRSPAVRRRYEAALRRQAALYRVLVSGRLLETAAPAAPAHHAKGAK
jgi:gluconokinase